MHLRHSDQLTAPEMRQRRLHGALRQPARFGDILLRHRDARPIIAMRVSGQHQIHKKCRRLPIVTNEVRHQRIEDVWLERNGHADLVVAIIAIVVLASLARHAARRESERSIALPVPFATPAMIKRVKFVSIPVRDQDRALAFYTEKLGFKVSTDAPMGPGMRWIELRMPRAETGVVLFTAPGQETWIGSFMNISFETDDVHGTAAELKAAGVEFVKEPTTESWGTSAIFLDSEGNRFVLSTG